MPHTPSSTTQEDWLQELEQLDAQLKTAATTDTTAPATTTATATTATTTATTTAVADGFLDALARFEAGRNQRQQDLQKLVPGHTVTRVQLLSSGKTLETKWELQGKYPGRTVRRELLWLFQAPCCLDVEIFTTPQALGEKPVRFCECQRKQGIQILHDLGL